MSTKAITFDNIDPTYLDFEKAKARLGPEDASFSEADHVVSETGRVISTALLRSHIDEFLENTPSTPWSNIEAPPLFSERRKLTGIFTNGQLGPKLGPQEVIENYLGRIGAQEKGFNPTKKNDQKTALYPEIKHQVDTLKDLFTYINDRNQEMIDIAGSIAGYGKG